MLVIVIHIDTGEVGVPSSMEADLVHDLPSRLGHATQRPALAIDSEGIEAHAVEDLDLAIAEDVVESAINILHLEREEEAEAPERETEHGGTLCA